MTKQKQLTHEEVLKWMDPAQTPWLQRQVWPPPAESNICKECGGGTFIELGGADANNSDFCGGATYHPNLDIRKMPGVDMVWDLETGKIPYHDNHADRIKMVHVINHLTKVTADKILKECLRVLKPNGVLFIMVTDMEFILRKALEDGMPDAWITGIWGTKGDSHEADFHYWGYTPDSLKALLYDTGFRHVVNCGNPNAWEFRMNAVK